MDRRTALGFWAAVSAQPRLHAPHGKSPVYVRTTYFDTADFAYYRGTAGPVSRRIRVREYASAGPDGIPLLNGICVLELKQSALGRRSKTRVGVAPDEVADQLARFGGPPLTPCLTTWYRRAALTDRAERMRLTLDARIRFCAPTPVGAPCDGIEPAEILAAGPAFVLEVKLWDEPPAWLARALQGLDEAVGYSKFMAGMQAAEARGLLCPQTDY